MRSAHTDYCPLRARPALSVNRRREEVGVRRTTLAQPLERVAYVDLSQAGAGPVTRWWNRQHSVGISEQPCD
jgi:hypothetical protein